MNYANMIEEKNLKKTFIIATLCSTLIGTFTSSMGLWDRVNDKRKQKHTDSLQNNEIKQLREQVEKNTQAFKEREDQLTRRRDDLGSNFQMSSAMIQRQYDEGYGKLGSRFAIGDTLTENQLQAQIIALQQTVINVLQDALYNNRQLTRADLARVTAASDAARENSVDALRKQQQRLALEEPPIQSLSLGPSRRDSPPMIEGVLFCPYSTDLQYLPDKPLAADFAPGGKCRCPDCGQRIPVTADDFWKIGKTTPVLIADKGYEKKVVETREFVLRQRFVVKCHTPDGQYACVLCNKHRNLDALCRSVEALVNHVGKFHDAKELEMDFDLRETRPSGTRLALPPPPAPMPPSGVTREKEIKEVVYR